MKHPLRRFATSPSLACGGRGTLPVAWRSQFHGSPEELPVVPGGDSMNTEKEKDDVCRLWMQ